jgi:MFS superfamily sulfate permease-like transporter
MITSSGNHRMRAWIDMTLMGLTFFLTIIWSVQVGVTVSLIISLLLVVRRSSRTRMTILVRGSFIKQDVRLLRFIGRVRAIFQEPIDGNQSMRVQVRRRIHQVFSSFGFAKIWTLVCSDSTRIRPPQLYSPSSQYCSDQRYLLFK